VVGAGCDGTFGFEIRVRSGENRLWEKALRPRDRDWVAAMM
jgi:hypothetical protein